MSSISQREKRHCIRWWICIIILKLYVIVSHIFTKQNFINHIFNNWFISKLPQFSVNYNTNINSDGRNEYISFNFLDILKLYEHHNIQEKNLSEKMNKIDVHLSNSYPDMKMNFNTLQYFQVLDQNNMNNEQNAELLLLSPRK